MNEKKREIASLYIFKDTWTDYAFKEWHFTLSREGGKIKKVRRGNKCNIDSFKKKRDFKKLKLTASICTC
jgi:hypothetical protein